MLLAHARLAFLAAAVPSYVAVHVTAPAAGAPRLAFGLPSLDTRSESAAAGAPAVSMLIVGPSASPPPLRSLAASPPWHVRRESGAPTTSVWVTQVSGVLTRLAQCA